MTVEAVIKCSNNIVKSYADRGQLLKYPNARSARIKSLEIKGQRDSCERSIRLNFGENDPETITGSISCDPSVLQTVENQVSQVLEDTKPRYSLFATFSEIGLMAIVMIAVLALIGYLFHRFVATTRYGTTEKITFTGMHPAYVALAMLGILIAVFAIPFCVHKIREFLFPRHVFALGQGRRRHEFLKSCRLAAFMGTIITFIAVLAAAVVSAHMHI